MCQSGTVQRVRTRSRRRNPTAVCAQYSCTRTLSTGCTVLVPPHPDFVKALRTEGLRLRTESEGDENMVQVDGEHLSTAATCYDFAMFRRAVASCPGHAGRPASGSKRGGGAGSRDIKKTLSSAHMSRARQSLPPSKTPSSVPLANAPVRASYCFSGVLAACCRLAGTEHKG